MDSSQLIKGRTWQLSLPEDWNTKPKKRNGASYFESEDGTKGLYISVWELPRSEHKNNAKKTFRNFWETEIESFGVMEHCSWKLSKVTKSTSGPALSASVSAYDSKLKYQITAKVLVFLPYVLRTSFHDYACSKAAASRKFSDPIINSARLVQ
jgi:hypothetical protein